MKNDVSVDERVDDAILLRDRGKEREAIADLVEIIREHPDSLLAYLILGGLYRDHEEYERAVLCFREALRIQEDHELASLGLFHTLYDLGNWQAAIVEMSRFMSIADSEEYRKMAPDILKRHGRGVE